MLSIISTFREALLLAAKNFWFFIALTAVTKLPMIFVNSFFSETGHRYTPSLSFLRLALALLGIFLTAINTAAVLELLKKPLVETALWLSVWKSVQAYTWTLFRLFLLLGGIAILMAIPFAFVMKLFGPAKVVTFLMVISYLIFAKYALADPLVVNENMGALAALQRSWQMTRGHFWYVGGCYLFLGGGMWLASWLMTAPLNNVDDPVMGVYMATHFCFALADSFWIVLAWCMYQRIKTVDVPFAATDKALA